MAVAPIEPHALHSERLIFHAELEIVQGDRLQASEKAWGAVAHRVKAGARAIFRNPQKFPAERA